MELNKNIPSRKKTTATTISMSPSSSNVESQRNTFQFDNFDDLDFNNTVRYVESGTSQLEREMPIMSPCTFEEINTVGVVIYHGAKIDIEEKLESANLRYEAPVKCFQQQILAQLSLRHLENHCTCL